MCRSRFAGNRDLDPDVLLTSTESMSSTKLFGTDGIRGQAGEYPLNSRAIAAIGRAIGEKLGGKVFIGQDTRVSSPWIFDLLQTFENRGEAHGWPARERRMGSKNVASRAGSNLPNCSAT